MSNVKKALRKLGAKVKKSQPAVRANPQEALNASMAMFINAQGAFLQGEITKARKEGLDLGLGIDTAESLRLLAVESATARALLTEAIDGCGLVIDDDDSLAVAGRIRDFLAKPPQRFALKAAASAPTAPSDSPPAVAPPAPESESLAPAPPVAPPAGEAPAAPPA